MAGSIEVTQLLETYTRARQVYEEIVHEEQHTMEHLEETRAKRLRQEGFVACLDLLLRPLSVEGASTNGYQEEQEVAAEEEQAPAPALVEEGQG